MYLAVRPLLLKIGLEIKISSATSSYKYEIDLDEGLKRLIDWRSTHIKRLKLEEKQLEFNKIDMSKRSVPIAKTSLTEDEINSVLEPYEAAG